MYMHVDVCTRNIYRSFSCLLPVAKHKDIEAMKDSGKLLSQLPGLLHVLFFSFVCVCTATYDSFLILSTVFVYR